MKFHVLTLFPDMVLQGLNTSIIGRAVENNLIEIHAVNIRDYSTDKHGKVDDYPYGGGAGMLMQAQPVYDAWSAVREGMLKNRSDREWSDRENCEMRDAAGKQEHTARKPRTVYVTPQGRTFDQQLAAELAKEEELIFLCGHYEGIDERVLEEIVTDHVSIGDYVLTGGELPAMVMIDAIARLVPGVLHNDASAVSESFFNDLLEYPQYSRPEVWHDREVPGVLLTGDHRKVAAWRLEQARARTAKNRPDLYEKYDRKQRLIKQLSKQKRNHIHMMESLDTGRAEILFWEDREAAVWDAGSRRCMLTADGPETLAKMLSVLPRTAEEILLTVPGTAGDAETFGEVLGRAGETKSLRGIYAQFLYTQKVPLPVRYKEIRVLGPEQAQGLPESFFSGEDERAEVLAQIAAGKVYGAFREGKVIGIAGIRRAGDVGFLHVDEPYRRQGLGASLEAYGINRLLEEGRTPYGHVDREDLATAALQEKLGLYRADNNFILFS